MKKTWRFRLAMLIGKMAMFAQKVLGMNATYFPGKLAIRICPDFLGQIEKPPMVIGVTGTNGKTTCANLIGNILVDQGYDVISNKMGSNINAGIASTLISGSSITGKAKHIAYGIVTDDIGKIVFGNVFCTQRITGHQNGLGNLTHPGCIMWGWHRKYLLKIK